MGNVQGKIIMPVFITYKIHDGGNIKILALADYDLIGKIIKDKKIKIDISEEFYGHEKCNEDKIKLIIGDWFDSINAIGESAVNILIEAKIISRDHVIMLGKIPHAQIYSI